MACGYLPGSGGYGLAQELSASRIRPALGYLKGHMGQGGHLKVKGRSGVGIFH